MLKKGITELCRILLAVTFLFSGFVKAVDPLGGAYKLHDYFVAFGINVPDFFELVGSIALASIEFALGACILFGVYRFFTTLIILVFMGLMTPLTLYLALANPVSDCGCFGDALKITNWETFFKNIVLLAAAITTFKFRALMKQVYTTKVQWFVVVFSYLFAIGVACCSYFYLPGLDFRPYKVGANIPELMVVPEGMPSDEYATTFIYEKDGVQKEFTLENYPEDDSTWVFVSANNVLVKKGYEPPIHDFTIVTSEGADITQEVLTDPGYTFLVISPKFAKATDENVERLNTIYDFAAEHGYKYYALTASTPDEIQQWIDYTGAEYPICTTDEITLKTVVRSNPGLVLLKNGTIMDMWSFKTFPDETFFDVNLDQNYLNGANIRDYNRFLLYNVLCFTLPLLLVYIYDYFRNRRKNNKIVS